MSKVYEFEGLEPVFKGIGVLVKEANDPKESYKRSIVGAYRYPEETGDGDRLVVVYPEPPANEFPVDIEETTVDPDTGIITFSVFDGNYTIRGLEENDGTWLSEAGTPLPVEELEKIVEQEGQVS